MRKRIALLLTALACILPLGAAAAYPFCGPHQPPSQSSAFCRYDLVLNDYYRVTPGLPFVWLRAEPSSTAAVRATVWPSTGASLVTVGGSAHWDGYQWWYEMATYPDGRGRGWVERVSLAQVVQQSAPPVYTPVPFPATPIPSFPATPVPMPGVGDPSIEVQANWRAPFDARVEAGVPFLWIRQSPNSGGIVGTLGANAPFRVLGPAAFDGRQWWWQVQAAIGSAHLVGWVEQGSITPVG